MGFQQHVGKDRVLPREFEQISRKSVIVSGVHCTCLHGKEPLAFHRISTFRSPLICQMASLTSGLAGLQTLFRHRALLLYQKQAGSVAASCQTRQGGALRKPAKACPCGFGSKHSKHRVRESWLASQKQESARKNDLNSQQRMNPIPTSLRGTLPLRAEHESPSFMVKTAVTLLGVRQKVTLRKLPGLMFHYSTF